MTGARVQRLIVAYHGCDAAWLSAFCSDAWSRATIPDWLGRGIFLGTAAPRRRVGGGVNVAAAQSPPPDRPTSIWAFVSICWIRCTRRLSKHPAFVAFSPATQRKLREPSSAGAREHTLRFPTAPCSTGFSTACNRGWRSRMRGVFRRGRPAFPGLAPPAVAHPPSWRGNPWACCFGLPQHACADPLGEAPIAAMRGPGKPRSPSGRSPLTVTGAATLKRRPRQRNLRGRRPPSTPVSWTKKRSAANAMAAMRPTRGFRAPREWEEATGTNSSRNKASGAFDTEYTRRRRFCGSTLGVSYLAPQFVEGVYRRYAWRFKFACPENLHGALRPAHARTERSS